MSFIEPGRWAFYVAFPNDLQALARGRQVLLNRLDGVISGDGHARIGLATTVDPTRIDLMIEFDETVPPEEIDAMFRATANLAGRPGTHFGPPEWENAPNDRPTAAPQAEYSV